MSPFASDGPRPEMPPDRLPGSPTTSTQAIDDEISRGLLRVFTAYYGRGPRRVTAIWIGELLVCVLEGLFTESELALVDEGHAEHVLAGREAFRREAEYLFRDVVEGATGKVVLGVVGEVSDDGFGSEIFVLV
jgi:uncharacterized protein YbcI